MSKEFNHWQASVLSRFADRNDIGKRGLYERYFSDLPEPAVLECLALLEEEYSLPAGLLRPEDQLAKIFEPIPASNPWRWLVYRSREEDRQSEINYQLAKRQDRYKTRELWVLKGVNTLNDLIRAWCGQKPRA
jgi:hypothetical protein